MKTSVPGLAAPEEPSTPPPSPRGTCLAEGVGHACLAQSSLSSLSHPVAQSGLRAQGSHRVSLDVARLGGHGH